MLSLLFGVLLTLNPLAAGDPHIAVVPMDGRQTDLPSCTAVAVGDDILAIPASSLQGARELRVYASGKALTVSAVASMKYSTIAFLRLAPPVKLAHLDAGHAPVGTQVYIEKLNGDQAGRVVYCSHDFNEEMFYAISLPASQRAIGAPLYNDDKEVVAIAIRSLGAKAHPDMLVGVPIEDVLQGMAHAAFMPYESWSKRAITESEASASRYWRSILCAEMDGRLDVALDLLSTARQECGPSYQLVREDIMVRWTMGSLPKDPKIYETWISSLDGAPGASLMLGTCHLATGNLPMAETVLAAADKERSTPLGLYLWACCKREMGDLVSADDLAHRAIAMSPQESGPRRILFDTAAKQGTDADVTRTAAELMAHDQQEYVALDAIRLMYTRKNKELARKLCEEVMAHAHTGEGLRQLGMIALAGDDDEMALKVLNFAVDDAPLSLDGVLTLARLEGDAGRLEVARGYYEQALRQKPGDSKAIKGAMMMTRLCGLKLRYEQLFNDCRKVDEREAKKWDERLSKAMTDLEKEKPAK